MAGNFSIPIQPVSTVLGNQWRQQRIIEEASQTFAAGVPVMITVADGGLTLWNGTSITTIIAGISYEPASNLGTTGASAPTPLSPFSGVGAVSGTFGTVPNQSSAKNIAHGAPLNDGRCGFTIGGPDVIFSAAFGSNNVATTPAATDVTVQYGLTKDGTNTYWYVDKNKTGGSAVLTVIGLDPRDTPAAGTRVLFTFLPASLMNLGADAF